ncbi:MAG: deoxyribodipyrimidine photolyase [Proteobacteria bacterium]|nr:MAG: deoxyribodipyrimidine photolyase [Pseudomonadota bacterium]
MTVIPPSALSSQRLTAANDAPLAANGAYILYWMTSNRRRRYNHALQRAVELSRALRKPLVVLEALRLGYRWASARLHGFMMQGMADNAAAFADVPLTYLPYLERAPGEGKGLLEILASRACVVVGDEYPCFFLPRMHAAVASRLRVRYELVDGNGLLPMRAIDKLYQRAYDLRRYLQKTLPRQLLPFPHADPLASVTLPRLAADALPTALARWPLAKEPELRRPVLDGLELDPKVGLVASTQGGHRAARSRLETFLDEGLPRYAEERNQPQQDVSSGLSPYLHFGHIGVFEVMDALFEREGWSIDRLGAEDRGQREGFWGVSTPAESFLDELVTWRELGFNFCHFRPDDYHRYESLPAWARESLELHASDEREHLYDLVTFEEGRTHDPLWNAAQGQLLREGRIHNYLRMLWGKKILEWTEHPRQALGVMLELNNKYGLDGRDPNSYSGILWVLGRYDRAWGPERPIFGKIRYMSSENTARKVKVKEYIARYGS